MTCCRGAEQWEIALHLNEEPFDGQAMEQSPGKGGAFQQKYGDFQQKYGGLTVE